jgi:site-specific DNA-methyltransferase (adenine-specific)
MIYEGDCLDIMPTLESESVDSIVCDPPYGLSFMGKDWDHGVPGVPFWEAALRVAKPGAYMLAFGGTRTFHRLAVAIEDAGWEIRDTVMWVYGSGFPKSLDVSKAIDKAAGAERQVVGVNENGSGPHRIKLDNHGKGDTGIGYMDGSGKVFDITAPATDTARQWEGWGTALKPAWEPVLVCRKPLIGTVAANVLKYGTGGLNIDGCRVGIDPKADASQLRTMNRSKKSEKNGWGMNQTRSDTPEVVSANGRWPANLIYDGSDQVVGLFPVTTSGKMSAGQRRLNSEGPNRNTYGYMDPDITKRDTPGDSGSTARFFYCAKASREDRNEGLNNPGPQFHHGTTLRKVENTDTKGNFHPTVKPTALMRYLCRLVTPPGGVILDPFMGSGSTGKAAAAEGFGFIGIELNPEYVEIADKRINSVQPLLMTVAEG